MIRRTFTYSLCKNNFNNVYYASLYPRTAYLEDFLMHFCELHGKEFITELNASLQQFYLENFISGRAINIFDLCIIYPKIKGKFNGRHDCFDPYRHRITLDIRTGERYSNLFTAAPPKLKKVTSITRC